MPKIVQTAGRDSLGTFAPDFARYNDDILFGEVWSSDALSLKERSMIVISIFMGRGLADSSLMYHLQTARKNGLTKEEAASLISQGAFYAGWPVAWAVFNMAKEVWKEDADNTESPDTEDALEKSKQEYARELFFPIGEPNDAYAAYFDGKSWLAPISNGPIAISNVTFEPGCRNHWHIHHAASGGGQVLICVGGRGWYQEWGKEPVEMVPGTIVEIPAGVKHWHGAADDSWFSHLAFEIPGTETSNEWLEAVKR